jgi:antitoxin PrlF
MAKQEVNQMRSKVAARGQVTIPKKIRDRLGIRPGTILEFSETRGILEARKVEHLDPVDQFYGSIGRERKTEEVMRSLRGES